MKFIRNCTRQHFLLFCFALILAVQVGCEQSIPLAIEPQELVSFEVQGATKRSSYRWPVGRTTFDTVAPSRLNFFEKTRDTVNTFLETKPLDGASKELFIPQGLNSNLVQLVDRIKFPRAEITTVASIPFSDKPGCYALSRDGSKIAIHASGKLAIWNVQTGQLETPLKSQIENAEQIVFNMDASSLFVASPSVLGRIDIEFDRIGATTNKFPSKVVQIATAVDVNKLVIRCEDGEILITDENMETLTQLPKAVVKSDVAISDRGDRIAFWNDNTPTEVELNGLEFGRRDIVENIKYKGGERHVICGRFSTQWIHGREVFHWWHKEMGKAFTDRSWVGSDLTWNPIAVVSTSPMEYSDSRLMIASRKNIDGERELIASDINCSSLNSSSPTILPKEATSFRLSYKGNFLAYQLNDEIKVCSRVQWQYGGHEPMFNDAWNVAMIEPSTEQLELFGEFILKNDFWWHYGLSAQDVFTQFSQLIGESWINLEQEEKPSEETTAKLAALEEWFNSGSDLARASSGSRRIYKAWRAVRVSGRQWFTSEGNKTFYEEMTKLRSDISPMLRKKDPCNAAYNHLLFYMLVTDSNLDQVDSILQQSISKNPECVQPYITTIPMLTEQWLGDSEDVSVFARELKSLYGNDLGSTIYPRLCIATRRMFETHQGTWHASKLNYDSMIEGLDLLARRKILSKKTFNSAFSLMISRENVDKKLRNIVNHYVEQNAFVPTMLLQTTNAGSSSASNAGRYHILRYMAQLYNEPLPEIFE